MDLAHLNAIGLDIAKLNATPSRVCAKDATSVVGNIAKPRRKTPAAFMALSPGGSAAAVCLRMVSESEGFKGLAGAQAISYTKGRKRLGLDCGGVLAVYGEEACEGEDTAFADSAVLDHLFTPGCFKAVEALVERLGAENIFIVSKAGAAMAEKTCKLLHEVDFFRRTGLKDDGEHVFFCTERRMKTPIVQELGISHFADDRWGILSQLPKNVRGYLFPSGANDGVTVPPPGDLLKKLKTQTVDVGMWSTLCAGLDCHIDLPDDRLCFCSETKQWISAVSRL